MRKTLSNRKGASVFVEQIFIILFGVVLFIMVITSFALVRDKALDFMAEAQFKSIGTYVQNAVVQAATGTEFSEYGRIVLSLPPTVAQRSYKVYLNNTTIQVIVPDGTLNSTINMYKVDLTLSGNISSTAGGRHFVTYNRTAKTIVLETETKVFT